MVLTTAQKKPASMPADLLLSFFTRTRSLAEQFRDGTPESVDDAEGRHPTALRKILELGRP